MNHVLVDAATDFDNRGTKEEPYGFVYFTDGTRIVYALGKVHSESVAQWKRQAAVAFLATHGITVTLLGDEE